MNRSFWKKVDPLLLLSAFVLIGVMTSSFFMVV